MPGHAGNRVSTSRRIESTVAETSAMPEDHASASVRQSASRFAFASSMDARCLARASAWLAACCSTIFSTAARLGLVRMTERMIALRGRLGQTTRGTRLGRLQPVVATDGRGLQGQEAGLIGLHALSVALLGGVDDAATVRLADEDPARLDEPSRLSEVAAQGIEQIQDRDPRPGHDPAGGGRSRSPSRRRRPRSVRPCPGEISTPDRSGP